jgi:rhomboid protease GluP
MKITTTPPAHGEDTSPKIVDLMQGKLTLTPATVALICINIGVFGAMLFNGAGLWHSPNHIQLTWGAGFGPATKDGEWWRLATALCLHFGLVHLAMNMGALWEAGRLVERLYGSLRFVIIYLASGLTGNLLSLIVQGDRAISGGASGAIFGVYGALLVCLWRERQQIDRLEFRWLFGSAMVFSVATILLGVVIPGIDNAAHIGGLISGALAGVCLLRPLAAGSPKTGRGRWAAGGAHALAVIALVYAIPAASYRWQEELQAREQIRQFMDDDRRLIDRWQQILDRGRQGAASFEQLAGQIETDITSEYRDSFEHLSALHLDPKAPSTTTVNALKTYSQLRSEASQSLADALRKNDPQQFNQALELARRAPYIAHGVTPPPARLP